MIAPSKGERAIAIVGIGCRYPGGADSPGAFWRMLNGAEAVIGPMPGDRFDVDRLVDPEPRTPGRMVTRNGGFLEAVDRFDAGFFGISAREAKKIDPQQRLLLEVAWEALEDGGIVPSALAGGRTGVYVGLWSSEYEQVMSRRLEDTDLYATQGGGRYSASGRISFALDLRGPSMTLDTACSSSLVAIHLACQSLRARETDLALAGAANLILQPYVSVAYSRSGMLSPSGLCRFGEPDPDGYVRSEGAAVLALKRLDDALADGDPIHAVVLGSAVNSDGRGSGRFVAPSLDAQIEMLRTAWADAGVAPSRAAYVEAHGTGTAAGDSIELAALGEVFGRRSGEPLAVGSVKQRIGHAEAASGAAGLIRAVLGLRHGVLPPASTARTRNADIPWSTLGVMVAPDPVDLNGGSRVVGVNSFGVSGTNAHIVLGSPPPVPSASRRSGPHVVTLSAQSDDALNRAVEELATSLAADAPDLADLSLTSTVRREHHPRRLAVVAMSIEDVHAALREHASGEAGVHALEGTSPAAPRRIGFVFSGQGSQWDGMGRELLRFAPVFAATIDECDAAFAEGGVLRAAFEHGTGLDRVDVIQPSLCAFQIAFARQLMAWGIRPAAVAGHSMGEVAAACIAGRLSQRDAMRVIRVRSQLLAEIAGQGAMALVDADEAETRRRLRAIGGGLSIASINGPRSTVVSGDPDSVDAFVAQAERDGMFARTVRVDIASHSAQTEPLLPRLEAALADLTPWPGEIPFHSTARTSGETTLDAGYWSDNLRRPVQLLQAVRALIDDGIDVLVEIAPHPILVSSLGDIAAHAQSGAAVLAGPRRDASEHRQSLELLARLHVTGATANWSALADPAARHVRLPTYPWQRERYWLEQWDDWSGDVAGAHQMTPVRPALLDEVAWNVAWEPARALPAMPPRGRWLVVGGGAGQAAAIASSIDAAGGTTCAVVDARALGKELGNDARVEGIVFLGALTAVGADDIESGMVATCVEAIAVVRALVDAGIEPAAGTWWLTRGVHGVGERQARLDAVAQASLWGLVRTLWQEHPALDAHLVDLDPSMGESQQAARWVEAISTLRDEAQVAICGDELYAARLRPLETGALSAPVHDSADAAWLVTGGLGALGSAVAEELVGRGVRRLILAGRTPLPERDTWTALTGEDARRVDVVRRLESLGAAVHPAVLDVADDDALAAFLDRYRAEAWPPIRGVVHCAGELDNALVADMDEPALRRTLHGKATGAWNLHRRLPELEAFVLFSSVVAHVPQSGQANYAAANAFLDALAAARRAAGLPGISLGWGVWRGDGLVSGDRGALATRLMEEDGLGAFDVDEGRALFAWAAEASAPHVVLSRMDGTRLRSRLIGRPGAPFYEGIIGPAGIDSDDAGTRFDRPTMRTEIRRLVGLVLEVDAAAVSLDRPLGQQGLDSLSAMDLRNRLERLLSRQLPASLAWNYPTIEALSEYLSAPADPSASSNGVPTAAATGNGRELAGVSAVLEGLNDWSDDDVLRELRGGR